jgi:hypothetical protein
MAMNQGEQTGVIISTAVVALLTGYAFGIYTIRGYLIPPSLFEERRRNLHDPVESDESDIDEDDTVLDHAPNWANGADADKRQGLKNVEKEKEPVLKDNGEECKLVLVVRTDLGMTKGMLPQFILQSSMQSANSMRCRQNRCSMLPRNPRMLQDPLPRTCQLSPISNPQALGTSRPGQDCRASQEPRRDARAST